MINTNITKSFDTLTTNPYTSNWLFDKLGWVEQFNMDDIEYSHLFEILRENEDLTNKATHELILKLNAYYYPTK